MQLPTHVIFGVAIQIAISILYPRQDLIFFVMVFVIALLSHFILDSLAIMTYHPPNRQQTKFWLYWHIFVYLTGIFFIIVALVSNPLLIVGIIGANVPDLWDWVLLRWILKSTNKKLYIHKFANKIRSIFKNHVPELTYSKIGILPESVLISLSVLYIVFQFM